MKFVAIDSYGYLVQRGFGTVLADGSLAAISIRFAATTQMQGTSFLNAGPANV